MCTLGAFKTRPDTPLSEAPQGPTVVLFDRYPTGIGLNVGRLRKAVARNSFTSKSQRDWRDGQSFGVAKTSTFITNSGLLMRFSQQGLRALIDEE